MLARQIALFGLVVGVAVVAMSGCSARPPDLGLGASSNYAFNERVQRLFPVGSDESALVTELRRERFSITPHTSKSDSFIARYEAGGVACKRIWTLLWSTDQRKISDIAAKYGETCL